MKRMLSKIQITRVERCGLHKRHRWGRASVLILCGSRVFTRGCTRCSHGLSVKTQRMIALPVDTTTAERAA